MDINIIDMESICNYFYMGKEYYLDIYNTEENSVLVFASFQVDVDKETDDIVGMGEDYFDKNTAIIKAIKNLHSQFN